MDPKTFPGITQRYDLIDVSALCAGKTDNELPCSIKLTDIGSSSLLDCTKLLSLAISQQENIAVLPLTGMGSNFELLIFRRRVVIKRMRILRIDSHLERIKSAVHTHHYSSSSLKKRVLKQLEIKFTALLQI